MATVIMLAGLLVLIFPGTSGVAASPYLSASPTSARAGDALRISGTGFLVHSTLQLIWDGSSKFGPSVKVGGRGTFSARVTVVDPTPGLHTVTAIGTASSGIKVIGGTSPDPIASVSITVLVSDVGTATSPTSLTAPTQPGLPAATAPVTAPSDSAPQAPPASTQPSTAEVTAQPTAAPVGTPAAARTAEPTSLPVELWPPPNSGAICGGRLGLSSPSSPTKLQLPYCSNHNLMARDLNVRRLIVVVHGDSRNAIDHERYVVQAAAGAGVTDAVIVAPQFLLLGDLTTNGLPTSTLYWDDGWKSGMPSASSPSPRPWSISSFAVIDQLIRLAASSFPNVQQITIVGHSAGGQFANRYAAESLIVAEVPRTYRFVAANPGSYVYLSADRYHLATDAFAALTTTEASACPRFNRYKHGLDLLNPYGAAVGASTIQTQYAQRAVTYLLGALDTDGSDPSLDTSCAAMWEGAQRLERGQLYYRYLTETYGSGITDRQHLAIVAGVAHDAKAIYNSATGLAVLFP